MKRFCNILLKFLRGSLLLGVLLGAFMATNLHGQSVDAKQMWKWNFVKGALFDNAEIMLDVKK